MLSYLLVYRFLLLNFLLFTGVYLSWKAGYTDVIFLEDQTRITWLMAAAFAAVWVVTFYRCTTVSYRLNESKAMGGARVQPSEQGKVWAKVQWQMDMSNWLYGLGLLGTIVGIIIAFGAVDQSALGSSSGVETSIGILMSGMQIALYTTGVGAVLGMWNEVNQRMFRTALACLLADMS